MLLCGSGLFCTCCGTIVPVNEQRHSRQGGVFTWCLLRFDTWKRHLRWAKALLSEHSAQYPFTSPVWLKAGSRIRLGAWDCSHSCLSAGTTTAMQYAEVNIWATKYLWVWTNYNLSVSKRNFGLLAKLLLVLKQNMRGSGTRSTLWDLRRRGQRNALRPSDDHCNWRCQSRVCTRLRARHCRIVIPSAFGLLPDPTINLSDKRGDGIVHHRRVSRVRRVADGRGRRDTYGCAL